MLKKIKQNIYALMFLSWMIVFDKYEYLKHCLKLLLYTSYFYGHFAWLDFIFQNKFLQYLTIGKPKFFYFILFCMTFVHQLTNYRVSVKNVEYSAFLLLLLGVNLLKIMLMTINNILK